MNELLTLIFDILFLRRYTVYAVSYGQERYRGRFRTLRAARRHAEELLDRPAVRSAGVWRDGAAAIWQQHA